MKNTPSQRRRIAAEFRALDYAAVRLPDADMQRLTGATRTTVTHWRTGKHPPPAAAVRLAALVYTGDLGMIWPDWRDFAIGRDGRLSVPGFRYGFAPAELLEWHQLVRQRDAFAFRIADLERRLLTAESRAAYYRWRVSLEPLRLPATV